MYMPFMKFTITAEIPPLGTGIAEISLSPEDRLSDTSTMFIIHNLPAAANRVSKLLTSCIAFSIPCSMISSTYFNNMTFSLFELRFVNAKSLAFSRNVSFLRE